MAQRSLQTAKLTKMVNCLDNDGLIVINEISVCKHVIINIPINGVNHYQLF